MKNKIDLLIKLTVVIFSVGSVIVTFFTFKSLIGQYKLSLDVGKFTYTPEEVDKMLPPIPNVTAVIIPINVSKALYLIKYNRLLEAVKLIESAENAQPYTKVGDYLKSRVFLASGVLDSALTNAKRAFYGWPKNINHFSTYNEVLVYYKDTLEILQAYKSLDSSLSQKEEYKQIFSKSYNKAKYAYLITEYDDSRNIDDSEIQGNWVRGYNFPNEQFIADFNYTFNFNKNFITNNLGETYKFKIENDSLNFYFNTIQEQKIMTYGIKYSDSFETLILKGIKLDGGIIQDQYYKRY